MVSEMATKTRTAPASTATGARNVTRSGMRAPRPNAMAALTPRNSVSPTVGPGGV
jgi:hypothetical protein